MADFAVGWIRNWNAPISAVPTTPMIPDPKSHFESQLGTEVAGVIGMFYPRQNSVLTLYFALGIIGVVGTADIGAFQFRIQSSAKSATASP